nr:MAG TPA: hypothetical protein [Caudoviricetes sp.]
MSGFAAQCCGPAFFVYGRAAEDDVRGGRWTGRGRRCGWRVRGSWTAQRRRRDMREARERKKEGCLSFSLGKTKRCFLCFLGRGSGSGSGKGAAGCRHRRENNACADCGTGRETPACRGLIPWRPVAVPAYPAYRP